MPLGYKDCEHCGFTFPTKNSRAQYCSDAHRAAANRAKRQTAVLLFSDAPTQPVPAPQTAPPSDPFAEDPQLLSPKVAAETEDDEQEPVDQAPAATAPSDHTGALETLTRQRLTTADRVETWEGQSALIFASRIDNHQGESGSGLKALWTSYREAMAMALSSAGAGAGSSAAAEVTTPEPEAQQAEPVIAGPIDMLAALRAREESRRDGTAS